MQLHDFNDMNSFPCNLRSLTICLSEVIFMEGFMRKVYQHLSSLEVVHLIGITLVDYSVTNFTIYTKLGLYKTRINDIIFDNLYTLSMASPPTHSLPFPCTPSLEVYPA